MRSRPKTWSQSRNQHLLRHPRLELRAWAKGLPICASRDLGALSWNGSKANSGLAQSIWSIISRNKRKILDDLHQCRVSNS
jgi:hypothetical protein